MKYTLKNKEIELTEEEVAEIVKQNSNPVEEKKVGIAIKNRFTGSIIFQSSKTTYRDAVNECIEEANKNGTYANLTDADLTHANLTDADLTRADLTRANLTDANLTDANLTGANLTACLFYMGSSNQNFEALCKAIKTIKWNDKTGEDFINLNK